MGYWFYGIGKNDFVRWHTNITNLNNKNNLNLAQSSLKLNGNTFSISTLEAQSNPVPNAARIFNIIGSSLHLTAENLITESM